jgi:hypothetical protein
MKILSRGLTDGIMNGASRLVTFITSIYGGFRPKVKLKEVLSTLTVRTDSTTAEMKTDKNTVPTMKTKSVSVSMKATADSNPKLKI